MKSEKFKSIILKSVLVLILALAFVGFGLGGHAKLASATCSTTPEASLGTDSLTVNAPSAGTYNVWVRMITPNSSDNSIYLQVNGNCAMDAGGTAITTNTFEWVDYQNGTPSDKMTASLNAGNNTILLTGKDADVGVDSVLFLDSSCVPTGLGSNCTVSTPPTVNITSPASGATVSGKTTTLSANATDTGSITSVVFKIDSTTVGTVTTPTSGSSYSTTWDSTSVSNGNHTLSVTATDSANLTTTSSETITVDNTAPTCTGNPSAPTISASANGMFGVNISWTASTPASNCSISSYTLYRDGTELTVTPSSTLSYGDSGLSPDTTYTYFVTATDGSGHISAHSNTASATTAPVTTPPSAPTNVVDQAPSPTEVDLSWTSSTDTVATIANYRVYRDGNLLTTLGASATSYVDNTVSPGTAYTYSVSAVDNYGNESTQTDAVPSPITTPSAQPAQPPTQPGDLTAEDVAPTSAEIKWKASTDNVPITDYTIFLDGTKVAATTDLSYTQSGLLPNDKYTFKVEAYNKAGQYSTPATLTITTTAEAGYYPLPIDGDINNAPGNLVNYLDLSILLNHWGQDCHTYPCGDIDGQPGDPINNNDLTHMIAHWSSGLSVPVQPKTGESTSISVYTADNNVCTNVSSVFYIQVFEDSDSTDVNAVEGWLTWDPSFVQFDGLNYDKGAFNDAQALSTVVPNSAGQKQQFEFARGTTSNTTNGTQLIATMAFTPKTAGTTYIYVRWHGTGIAVASNGLDLRPTPFGSKVTIGAANAPQPCKSSNSPGGGVGLPFPGTTSTPTSDETPSAAPEAQSVSSTTSSTVNSLPSTTTPSTTSTAAAYVVPAGGNTGLPLTSDSTVDVSVPSYFVPTAPGDGLSLNSVSYYLNGSLQTTKYGSNLAYEVDTSNLANGNYKLTAKEILNNGTSRNVNTTLNVNNTASLKQFWLQAKQYVWLVIAVIVILIGGLFAQKSRTGKSTKRSGWSQAAVDPDVRSKAKRSN